MTDRILSGAMSGTSADGVDIALVRVRGRGMEMSADLLHHHHCPYSTEIRRTIFGIRGDAAVELAVLAKLGRDITLAYAQAFAESLEASHLPAGQIAAIAAHGQTLFHDPPLTIQWFDPSLLAARTGRQVVSDFRRADCAVGGQGAPLVPFADYLLFRHPEKNRVLLNIGGIANLTYLPANCNIDRLIAFDTGPGNCISDWLMRADDPSGPGYDLNGARASRGSAIDLCPIAAREPFFIQPPPKSTDGPAMIALYERARAVKGSTLSLDDDLATAATLVARTIVAGMDLAGPRDEVIVSGGGVGNLALMSCLRAMLGSCPLIPIGDIGMPSSAKEAVAFALLGAATLDGEPANIPSVTGASGRVVLGSITPVRMRNNDGGLDPNNPSTGRDG